MENNRYRPEFGTRKEKDQFVGYSHNFERYIDIDGQRVDRLEQSLKYGFLSPREAQKLGILYKKNLEIIHVGSKDSDNIISLFPLRNLNFVPRWRNAVSVVFDSGLEVLSLEEMLDYQSGHWTHLSPIHGEVYVFGRIDPLHISQIALPNSSKEEIEQTRGLIKQHVPTKVDKIVVK